MGVNSNRDRDGASYVVTSEIKAAMAGRETDILDALDIDWRKCSGSHHLRCPYPEHGGDGLNWRWDAKQRKAHCSCQTGHADNALDVLLKVEGLDIEAGKIRAAEILGRPDLVKVKGKGGQRMDAASLMNPLAAMSDASLPAAYLGHRLGIAPGDVLMPSTATAGWRALVYWDPPAKQGGKPVEVGQFPCVAFATVAADGGTHCHRVYTGPSGAGKADLGTAANGSRRDPKKSAKAPADGVSTAGRSVLFGDARKASHAIVCEGIETGAALAHAFRREVAAGEVVVAAAISAGGVAAWQPWPATRRVTIGADRDEARTVLKPEPTRAGEKAAREFGLRRHDEGSTLDVRVALPGAAGTATDWLDVLRADGVEAVRSGIGAAVAFKPTAAELRDRAERAGREAELERIASLYPLPDLDRHSFSYRHTKAGRVWLHQTVKMGKGDNAEMVDVPIASPFGVTARLRVVDDADAYGLRLLLEDMDGTPRAVDVERKNLASMGGAEARGLFLEAGVRFQEGGDIIAVSALKAAHPEREIRIVRHPGWHDFDGARVYVGPGGEVIGLPEGQSVELAAGMMMPRSVTRAGTLEGWKAAAAAAMAAPRVPHFALGLAAGFAGVLVDLCGLDSCGINLSGQTSAGKTTAQRLAASVWSVPDSTRPGLFQVAKTTVNGLEYLARKANGSVFVLDELAHLNGKETGAVVYTLASGIGKTRMTAAANAREPARWKTFAILSSETSLEAKIRADGGSWTGGQAVRIADVDVSNINRLLDSATLDKINGMLRNYGHAGPAFAQALVAAGTHERASEVRDGINTMARRLAGQGADAARIRAALPLAILFMAGGMAQTYGLLPQGEMLRDAIRWAWAGFQESSDAVALDPAEQAISNIRTWIAERWRTSVQNLHAEERPMRDAVAWFDDGAIYLTPERLQEAAGGTLKEGVISRSLNASGMLAKRKSDENLAVFWVPKVGKLKAYALSRAHFGRDAESDGAFKSYAGGRA